jgi:hypothetical protein
MILKVHLQGAASYDVGDEIWQESLADAIHAEAETIAGYAGSDLFESPDQADRDALRDRLVDEMTSALGERRRPLPRAGWCSLLADRTVCAGSGERRR